MTHMIFFNQGMLLLGSNHFLKYNIEVLSQKIYSELSVFSPTLTLSISLQRREMREVHDGRPAGSDFYAKPAPSP